ncbi:MAG: hypothetical protein QOH70_650 [Blastocatellia bacterium]|jgi:hypothetical protein|nr:hypothetical protein [Blastocatellia bacterium]
MSTRLVAAIISLCLVIIAGELANTFVIRMIGEINRKREEGNLISPFWFTLNKVLRVFREYRALYPEGKLHLYAKISFATAIIALIIVAVCLHIIG